MFCEDTMKAPGFLKKKRTYAIIAVIALAVWGITAIRSDQDKGSLETFVVERRMLLDTTDVTGEIKPVARINLSFGAPGRVGAINVKVGAKVKQGDLLALLDAKDVQFAYDSATAQLAAAEAQLQLAIAGAKDQNVKISEAGVAQAEANLEKAKTDLANAKITTANNVATSELAVQTAQNSLDNQAEELEQAIIDAYETARASYLNALGPMQTALTDGDRVIGVDDQVTNAQYKFQLGIAQAGSFDRAKTSYAVAKTEKARADAYVSALTASSTRAEIEEVGEVVANAVMVVQKFLNDVTSVLSGTITGSYLSATELTTLKTTITTDRTAIATQLTTVISARQGAASAGLTRDKTISTLTDALNTAKLSLDTAKSQAKTTLSTSEVLVRVQEAAVKSARAQLDLTNAPPRSVDLDPLRAAVAQSRAAFDKAAADYRDAQIIAPVDGTISVVAPEIDERVGANQTVLTMLSGDTYDIEVLIPEADIAAVKVGKTASSTLDSYGDDIEFPGVVESIEPDQTLVQDAVYYKARISVETGDKEIRPGMTSNSVILLASSPTDAIIIPARAVSTDKDGVTTVKVLEKNGSTRTVNVELGMKGDEGRVVVVKGLSEGETIIVSQ